MIEGCELHTQRRQYIGKAWNSHIGAAALIGLAVVNSHGRLAGKAKTRAKVGKALSAG